MFKNWRDSADRRAIDEAIYAQVAAEVAAGILRDGLWAKAIAETGGSMDAAKALYLQLRAASIADELAIQMATSAANSRAQEHTRRSAASEAKRDREAKQRLDRVASAKKQAASTLETVQMLGVAGGALSALSVMLITAERALGGDWTSILMTALAGSVLAWCIKLLRDDVV